MRIGEVNRIVLCERHGVSIEAVRMAHNQITSGLTSTGHRVSSTEHQTTIREFGSSQQVLQITIEFEEIWHGQQ